MLRWSRKQKLPDIFVTEDEEKSAHQSVDVNLSQNDSSAKRKKANYSSAPYEPPPIAEQLENLDVFETVEDIPKFGRRSKHVPNTVLLNIEKMSREGRHEGLVHQSEKIEIRQSLVPCDETGSGKEEESVGMGVFVKPGQMLHAGDVITEYKGECSWVRQKDIDDVARKSRYVFAFGPLKIANSESTARGYVKYYAVIDGCNAPRNNALCCGQLLNTCSPILSSPYNEANCVFGVDISELILDYAIKPRIRVYAVALRHIKGGTHTTGANELTLDYHWELAYLYGRWCLDDKCYNCVAALKDWSTNHLKYLKQYYQL